MCLNIKPNVGKVLVKRFDPEMKSGGIIIPDTAQEKSTKGEIIAVGDCKEDEPYDFSAGDTIFFTKWAGTEIIVDDNSYIIIKMDEILAKVRKDAKNG